jgi:hypothetical protein
MHFKLRKPHTKFLENRSTGSETETREVTQTPQRSHKPTLFFKEKEKAKKSHCNLQGAILMFLSNPVLSTT